MSRKDWLYLQDSAQPTCRTPTIDATKGAGNTIAIVDANDDPNAESDLAVYRAQFGLPPCTTANGCFRKINQDGATTPLPAPDGGWSEEIALDLDVVSAVCPKCSIVLVEATSASAKNLGTAVNTAAAQAGVVAISNGYGDSEDDTTASLCDSYYTHPGIAITAPNGDSGYGVSWPASCPYVTAVGGTSLVKTVSGRGWTETVWDTTLGSEGTGSGCSLFVPKPSWQKDTGCSMRTVGDVAAVADPDTGVAVYDTYPNSDGIDGWAQFGGTTVSASLIAGVYALAAPAGAGDFPVSYLYANPGALFDVTVGKNGSCGSNPYLCTAEAVMTVRLGWASLAAWLHSGQSRQMISQFQPA
jgi:subtilase family serine protease